MKAAGSEILVGALGQRVCVKVEGKGTHQNSPSLREFLFAMMERGFRDISLDLAACTYMDSTFLGMLVGVALRLRKLGKGRFAIAHVSPRNLDLFQTLGIEQFFEIETVHATGDGRGLQSLPQPDVSVEQKAEMMLESHETLAKVDDRNVCRFKDVITFLKDDLARMKEAKDSPPANGSVSQN